MNANLAGVVEGTPERFVPDEMRGELIEAEHMARYWWATRDCSGRRVLDAGCGMAYGATMFKQAGASEVAAVDISEPVIEVARQIVPDGVTCDVADLASLPYEDQSFDLIACFETIEHVENPDAVLDELARVLAPEGLLLISSPNRASYVRGNPHHHHEYLPDELRAALASRFGAVRMYKQHAMTASVLSADGDAWDGETVTSVRRMVEPGEQDEVYTLAMAGRLLPDVGPPVVTLTQFYEVRRWLEQYDEQRQLMIDQAARLSELRQDRNEALMALSDYEQAKASQIEVELQTTAQVLADLQQSFSWRITAPIRWAKQLLTEPLRRIDQLLTARAKRFLDQVLPSRR